MALTSSFVNSPSVIRYRRVALEQWLFFIIASSQNESVGVPESAAPISVSSPTSRILIAVKDAVGAYGRKIPPMLYGRNFLILDAIRFLEQSAQPTPYSLVRPQALHKTSIGVKILLDIYQRGL